MSYIWPISIITCLALLLCIGVGMCSRYIHFYLLPNHSASTVIRMQLSLIMSMIFHYMRPAPAKSAEVTQLRFTLGIKTRGMDTSLVKIIYIFIVLHFVNIQRVSRFILNFAEEHSIILPGHIPGLKRDDGEVLPSCKTKTCVL